MPLEHLFYLVIFSVTVTGSRNKRLVLHSETDISQELQLLKDEVKSLKKELNNGVGTVYVRWGRTSCPHNETRLVYKGYMAGKGYNENGSGTNSLCLPEDPTWGNYQDGAQPYRAYIYGAEFENNHNVIFGKHVEDEDVPCAVCRVPGPSVMIPARVNCYPGWKLEYTGYLMADYYQNKGTDYVCVDSNPDFVSRGASNTDGHVIHHVEGRCGTLVCPPYYDHRELACVVCSM